MKILAVGMNYVAHCQELHANENLPKEPVIFMKPDSALLKDSKPFFIPDFSRQVDYETELVVRINRLGKNIAERFAKRENRGSYARALIIRLLSEILYR